MKKHLLSLMFLACYAAGSENEESGGEHDAPEQQPLSGVRVGDALNLGQALPSEMQKAKPGTFMPPHSADNTADVSTAATLPASQDVAPDANAQGPTTNEIMAADVNSRNQQAVAGTTDTENEGTSGTDTTKQATTTGSDKSETEAGAKDTPSAKK